MKKEETLSGFDSRIISNFPTLRTIEFDFFTCNGIRIYPNNYNNNLNDIRGIGFWGVFGQTVHWNSEFRIRMSEKCEDSLVCTKELWQRSNSFARHTNRPGRIAVVGVARENPWNFSWMNMGTLGPVSWNLGSPRNNIIGTAGDFLIQHRSSVGRNGIQPRVRYEERADVCTRGRYTDTGSPRWRWLSYETCCLKPRVESMFALRQRSNPASLPCAGCAGKMVHVSCSAPIYNCTFFQICSKAQIMTKANTILYNRNKLGTKWTNSVRMVP